ncbi:hypothetical protein D3C77_534230 [compost metagenome]
MLIAQEAWLPQYKEAVVEAKERQASAKRIPTREGYAGAARLHVKTVDEMKEDRDAANKNAREADKGKDRASVSN